MRPNFISTRGQDQAPIEQALSQGLAKDGGLFLPASWPIFKTEDFDHCTTSAAIGERLLAPFFRASRFEASFPALCRAAFTVPTPLKALPGGDTYLLELFHGPSGAFKDVGANFLATMLARLRVGNPRTQTILVATSGDTGSAVATAFHRRPGFQVVILFPDGRVSTRQAHLLSCFGDNIRAFRVSGSFDDCQALAKAALADTELVQALDLTSANSISLGRLLPQMVYYVEAAILYFRRHQRALNFVIPSGNLGNALACLLARKMGLPIGKVAISTNANHVLADYVQSGHYRPHATIPTIANAMDVGAPSNLERLIKLAADDRDMLTHLRAASIDDATIRARIPAFHREFGEIICPHTATAAELLARIRADGDSDPYAIVATAHPAKFADVVEPLLGLSIPIPPALQAWLDKPAQAEALMPELGALKRVLGLG